MIRGSGLITAESIGSIVLWINETIPPRGVISFSNILDASIIEIDYLNALSATRSQRNLPYTFYLHFYLSVESIPLSRLFSFCSLGHRLSLLRYRDSVAVFSNDIYSNFSHDPRLRTPYLYVRASGSRQGVCGNTTRFASN
ncbi:hypothetical protein AB1N83_012350 [Pleurotus pulmonarius]